MAVLRAIQCSSLFLTLLMSSAAAQEATGQQPSSTETSPFRVQGSVTLPGEISAIAPLGKKLLVGMADGRVQICDPKSGKMSVGAAPLHASGVRAIAVAKPDLWATTDGKQICIQTTAAGFDVHRIGFPAIAVAFSVDGAQLIAVSAEKEIVAWKLSDLSKRARVARYDDNRKCVDARLSGDGERVVFVMADG